MRKIVFLLVLNLTLVVWANSPETILFNAHVKSVEEFIARFNGQEIDSSIICNDSVSVSNRISAIIDIDYAHSAPSDTIIGLVNDLIKAVDKYNTDLTLMNSSNTINANCRFLYNGTERLVTLVFGLEEFEPGFKHLALKDVKGLTEAGIYNPAAIYPISPVEHEMHFAALDDILINKKEYVSATISRKRQLDSLSYMIALIESGSAKFLRCEDVKLQFHQIPDFIITVKEIIRPKSFNSGWLITEIRKLNNSKPSVIK